MYRKGWRRSSSSALAHIAAALPAASVRVTKQLMKKNRVTATEQQMVAEIEHFSRMLTAPEAKEAFTAFFEKRKPDFRQFA